MVKWTEEMDLILREKIDNGLKAKDIAKYFSVNDRAIYTRMYALGLHSKYKRPEPEHTKEQVLDIIKNNPLLVSRDYTIERKDLVPIHLIIKLFGSFTNAKKLAGVYHKKEKVIKAPIEKTEYRYITVHKEPTKNLDKKLAKVYLISFDRFYKVGITTQDIAARFNKLPVAYEVILCIELPIEEARSLEKYWLKSIKPFCTKEVLDELKYFDGKTECFIFE
jgi:hypothetical protein